uniref:P-type Cu(+) transporter n=1 Tax=Toxoplasma gondii COUG TaxID=1074873 RepID=A0A2G8XTP8_TOXGO|nr:plasma membrane-type Ca(2+)-ATPase A1 PMCAA1 [Toxoplasma gondii COUG]
MEDWKEQFRVVPRLFRDKWAAGLLDYVVRSPGLLISFLVLAVGQLFLTFFFLQLFRAPLLFTWWQQTSSLLCAFVLGEFGASFHDFRYFPRLQLPSTQSFLDFLPCSLSYCLFMLFSNVLISHIPNPLYLPVVSAVAVGLTQVFHFFGCSTAPEPTPLRALSVSLLVFPALICCVVSGSQFFLFALLSTAATVLFRACFLPKALHAASGRGAELNLCQNLTGALLLSLPALLVSDCPPTLTFSPFSLDLRNWQVGGCWVAVAVLPFFRNVIGNRLMRDGGADVWRAAEILALLLASFVAALFLPASLAFCATYAMVLAGRLLGCLDSLAADEKRGHLRRALIREAPDSEDENSCSDEPVLFVYSDGPATSFAQGSPSDLWPDDEDKEVFAERRAQLIDIVHAYVTRVHHEDVDMIDEMGGVRAIASALGSDLADGLPILKRHDSSLRASSFDGAAAIRESSQGFETVVVRTLGSLQTGDAATGVTLGRSETREAPQRPRCLQTRPAGSDADPLTGLASQESWITRLLRRSIGSEQGGDLVQTQQRRFGVNRIPHRPLTSFWTLLIEAASDATLRVLMLCGLLSVVLALLFSKEPEVEILEGIAIWVAVLVVVVVTAGNDWMKEQQFAKLSVVKDDKRCTVVRSGHKEQISVFQLVVGDILHLEAGDEVPADALVVQGRDLTVDESSLTGESDMIRKAPFQQCLNEALSRETAFSSALDSAETLPAPGSSVDHRRRSRGSFGAPSSGAPLQAQTCTTSSACADTLKSEGGVCTQLELARHHEVASPVLLSGTTVSTGSGTALVVAVGRYSQVGQMFQKLAYDAEPTPLQRKLNALAEDIGTFGLISAVVAFFVLLLEFWVMYFLQDPSKRESAVDVVHDHVEFFVTAITMLVVAVPEGLPLAVTISLAYSIGQMLRDQNYVRRLAACEIMGGANEICSDKTGTLTKNQMTVTQFWDGEKMFCIPSSRGEQTPGADPLSMAAEGEDVGDDVSLHAQDASRRGYIPLSAHSTAASSASPHFAKSSCGGAAVSEGLAELQEKNFKWEVLMQAIALNSTAFLETEEVVVAQGIGEETRFTQVKHVGSPTECALLAFQDERCGGDYASTRRLYLGEDEVELIAREDFSSDRKMMTSVVRILKNSGDSTGATSPASPGLLRVFVKGAGERVLAQCSSVLVADQVIPLTPERKAEVEKTVVDAMAAEALRTICLAYRDIDPEREPDWRERCAAPHQMFMKGETQLTCLGIAGIEDPVRDEVPGAVAQCQRAGIKVRMVTGDNIITAKAIAKRCEIFHEESGGLAMLGPDFTRAIGGVVCQTCQTEVCACATDAKTAEEQNKPLRVDVVRDLDAFDKIWTRLEVLARSQPSDKYALVTALKQKGRVVAVTGDGTNDAPALKKADVGFAMGLSGKEVAKQAADIVMLDDNFTCIVKAVKWGRNVYDNIRRFLQFQLTVNVVAVALTVVCTAVQREAPLSAVQMLWVNLIMDSFASLALATESPTDDLLNRKPQGRDSYLISRSMLTSIVAASIYQLTVMIGLIFFGERFLPETKWTFLSDEDRRNLGFCEFSDCDFGMYTGTRMLSGRRYKLFSTEDDYKLEWLREVGPSRHGTFVFNTFVFMQIFNTINARDVDDTQIEKSTSLSAAILGMVRNPLGLGIWVLIVLGQVLMTECGGRLLGCHQEGLNREQWMLSLLLGLGGLLWGRLPRVFPSLYKLAPEFGSREETLEETHSLALELRGRTPERMNERLGLASYTFAKKYAKKARLMTLSRLRTRRLEGGRDGRGRGVSSFAGIRNRGASRGDARVAPRQNKACSPPLSDAREEACIEMQ